VDKDLLDLEYSDEGITRSYKFIYDFDQYAERSVFPKPLEEESKVAESLYCVTIGSKIFRLS
jgi:hypothetical protein